MFEYMQSYNLLCINEGWEWTVDLFLNDFIKKAIEECTLNIKTTDDFDFNLKSDKLIAFYLLVQGNIISHMCPKNSSDTAMEALLSFQLLLEKNDTTCSGNHLIEFICVQNLILLAPFNPIQVFTCIQDWLEKYKNAKTFKLPLSLQTKIKYSYEFYKKRLPKNISLFV